MTRDELLLAITRCPKIAKAWNNAGHPCRKIVCSQPAEGFHPPEPWRGHIDTAPILFLSSNPSIDENDRFRASSSTDAKIIDYYQRNFDRDANHISPSAYNSVPFWTAVRARATEIIGRSATPGADFALTELVHCKSTGEQGVAEAHQICARRWLDLVLQASGADIIVLLGRQARDHCVARWKLDKGQPAYFGETIGGRQRAVVILPHPNARGKRKVADCVGTKELERLRALLAERD